MKSKITIKNIKSFIEGNSKMFLAEVGLQPQHLQEQVAYRSLICKETCVNQGHCEICWCPLPGKFYVKESCNNGEKFPDLMNRIDWEKFKKENNVE